jgi:hypothetical protein
VIEDEDGHPSVLAAAGRTRRLRGHARQPVQLGDHEDQRGHQEFRDRYLSDPDDPDAFEGDAVVFDGPEDYHHRIDDPAVGITEPTRSCSCAAPGRSAIRARPRS